MIIRFRLGVRKYWIPPTDSTGGQSKQSLQLVCAFQCHIYKISLCMVLKWKPTTPPPPFLPRKSLNLLHRGAEIRKGGFMKSTGGAATRVHFKVICVRSFCHGYCVWLELRSVSVDSQPCFGTRSRCWLPRGPPAGCVSNKSVWHLALHQRCQL